MGKPTLQSIHVELEKHIAITEERWLEILNRVKRVEHIMIGSAGTMIVLLLGVILRG